MQSVEKTVNFTVDSAIAEVELIDSQIEALEKKRLGFMTDINDFISADVSEQLESRDYKCGTANVDTDSYRIKYVVSKKVKWEQSKLTEIYDLIEDSGEDPSQYIKISYDVSETAYKAWPEKIAKVFEPARTVETSKPKISFERKK